MKAFINQRNVCAALALLLGLTILGSAGKKSSWSKSETVAKVWLTKK